MVTPRVTEVSGALHYDGAPRPITLAEADIIAAQEQRNEQQRNLARRIMAGEHTVLYDHNQDAFYCDSRSRRED